MPAKSHGLTRTAEYRTWQAMKQRCHNPASTKYYMYGAKGIEVCDAWRHSFECFLEDMGTKPSPTHSIERKDGRLGYSKDNCTWATPTEQASNIAHNRRLIHQGREQTLSQWAREFKVPTPTLINRLDHRQMTLEQALTYRAFQRVKE